MEITSFHKISPMEVKTAYSLYRITMISSRWLTLFFLSRKNEWHNKDKDKHQEDIR